MKRAIDWALMPFLFASFPKCMITRAQPLKLTIARAELSSQRISQSLHNDPQMFPSADGIQAGALFHFTKCTLIFLRHHDAAAAEAAAASSSSSLWDDLCFEKWDTHFQWMSAPRF